MNAISQELIQICVLHRRSGESTRERSRLFSSLKTTNDRNAAMIDALSNNKSRAPFGRG